MCNNPSGSTTNKVQIGNIAMPKEFEVALDKAKIFMSEFCCEDIVFPKDKLLSEINRYHINISSSLYKNLDPSIVPLMLRIDFFKNIAELFARPIDSKTYACLHTWTFTKD